MQIFLNPNINGTKDGVAFSENSIQPPPPKRQRLLYSP